MKLSERFYALIDDAAPRMTHAEGVAAVRALEADLDAERSRCQDLTARLDRARMELRAAEAARDEARSIVSRVVERLDRQYGQYGATDVPDVEHILRGIDALASSKLGGLVDDRNDMLEACEATRDKNRHLHRRAQAAESRAIKAERQAEVQRRRADSEMAERHKREAVWAAAIMQPAAPVDTRTGEAAREWAVGDACEVWCTDLGRWTPGSVRSSPVGDRVGVYTEGGLLDVHVNDLRPTPPTAMEPRAEGGRGLEAQAEEDVVERVSRRVASAYAEALRSDADVRRVLREVAAAVDAVGALQGAVQSRDTRIADLERRLREAEGQRTFMGTPSIAAMSEAELRATISSQSTAIYELREELEEARADEATSLIAATEALARAERAEEKLRRVREALVGAYALGAVPREHVNAAMAIIGEESGR